jgi:hypothetical protein
VARETGTKRSADAKSSARKKTLARKSGKPRRRTVYLSYSWDSAAHKEWVSRFAFRLEANGLKVVVDQWHLRLGESLPHFMETAIGTSDFVLLICTPAYKKRADERVGGVGYEQDLMTAERLVARHYNKFVPVLRAGDWYRALPKWIAGQLGVDLRGDRYAGDNFQNLVEHLLHAPKS